jgi:probable HAF family extracellular repeat protein
MRDLGTLGGTDSYAAGINDLGQVAGASRPRCSSGPCPKHAFVWQRGTMRDLGGRYGPARRRQ